MKRWICAFLTVLLLCALCAPGASATDYTRTYEYDLTINGSHEVRAKPGDVLTVMLTLRRVDAAEPADMFAMQDEIRYDDEFVQIVPGGGLTMQGIETTDLALLDGDRAFYMNYLSLAGGESWEPTTLVGTFQVKVLGERGSTVLKNENCRVSVKDGSDSFALSVQDVRIIVSSDCVITFDPMNGTAAWEEEGNLGSRLTPPKDPARAGYRFTGWYRDSGLTQKWNFDTDTVEGNMTLYAGWQEAEAATAKTGGFPWWLLILCGLGLLLILLLLFRRPTVTFDTDGGTEMKKLLVRRGDKLERPEAPRKPGADFVGWYKDEKRMKRWNFEEDTVEGSMTLYAKWH